MITADERAYHEKRITRAVLKARQRQLARLLDILGNPPDPEKYDRVPDELWKEIEKEERALFIPLLGAVAKDSAKRTAKFIGLDGLDPTAAADRYAEKRSATLARDATRNTRSALKDLLARLKRRGKAVDGGADDDRQEIADKTLGSIFGEARAESNGITETTSADSGAFEGIIDQAGKNGVLIGIFWRTEKDRYVCDFCKMLHGKDKSFWRQYTGPPPAHPRCRCELETDDPENWTYTTVGPGGKIITGFDKDRGFD